MPCLMVDVLDSSLIAAVDYLGFSDLAACIACSQRLLNNGTSPLLWDRCTSWRMKQLEGSIPAHARWRPAEDPELVNQSEPWKHLRAGASTFHFARGLQLYEQKKFEEAEDHLRALIQLLPGRPLALCRLADTLYGRAVSLLTHQRQPEHRSHSSTPPVIEAFDDEEEEQPAMLLSRSPMSPTNRPPPATVNTVNAVEDEVADVVSTLDDVPSTGSAPSAQSERGGQGYQGPSAVSSSPRLHIPDSLGTPPREASSDREARESS